MRSNVVVWGIVESKGRMVLAVVYVVVVVNVFCIGDFYNCCCCYIVLLFSSDTFLCCCCCCCSSISFCCLITNNCCLLTSSLHFFLIEANIYINFYKYSTIKLFYILIPKCDTNLFINYSPQTIFSLAINN